MAEQYLFVEDQNDVARIDFAGNNRHEGASVTIEIYQGKVLVTVDCLRGEDESSWDSHSAEYPLNEHQEDESA